MTTQHISDTAPVQKAAVASNGHNPQHTQMDSMTMRLKNSIEREGQFGNALNDMSEGYAAGRNIQFFEAKNEIKQRFYDQMQMTPKQYLDQCYSQRPQYSRSGHSDGQNNRQPQNETKQGRSR